MVDTDDDIRRNDSHTVSLRRCPVPAAVSWRIPLTAGSQLQM
jgi:hypothetical protein